MVKECYSETKPEYKLSWLVKLFVILLVFFLFLFVYGVTAFDYNNPNLPRLESLKPITTTTNIFNNLSSNSSIYWQNMNAINTTQMENNGGVLNILESWIRGIITAYGYLTTETDAKAILAMQGNNSVWLSTSNSSYVPYTGATANVNLTGYNLTINYIRINEIGGACDLTVNHSICSNASGSYWVG